MTKPDDSKKNLLVLISTIAVTLLLALIVLFAAFAPPSPEAVVTRMLESIADQDAQRLEKFVDGSALVSLQSAAQNQDSSKWRVIWDNGPSYFDDFRIGDVKVSGDGAEVIVHYGPGLILEDEFLLHRKNRHWKIYDFGD